MEETIQKPSNEAKGMRSKPKSKKNNRRRGPTVLKDEHHTTEPDKAQEQVTAVQESKKAGITKKDKNYSGSRKRHSKKAAKPGENPHQGNNSGPKAKSLPNTSSQPRSLPAIVPVELPVQTSKGSLGSETQAQARKPRKLQPVREEEVTLRASQDATIKAILAASVGAASGIAVHTNTNTIQASQPKLTQTDASHSRSHKHPKQRNNSGKPAGDIPTSRRRQKSYSKNKAMTLENAAGGKQASHSATMPRVTSDDFIKKASEHMKSTQNKYRRSHGFVSSVDGKAMTSTSTVNPTTYLSNASNPPKESIGNDVGIGPVKSMPVSQEPKLLGQQLPRNKKESSDTSLPAWGGGSEDSRKSAGPKSSSSKQQEYDEQMKRRALAVERLPGLTAQLIAMLPPEYRHIPKPKFLTEKLDTEAREKASKTEQPLSNRPDGNSNDQQHNAFLRDSRYDNKSQAKQSAKDGEQDDNRPENARSSEVHGHQRNKSSQLSSGGTEKTSNAAGDDKNESPVFDKRLGATASQSSVQQDGDGEVTLWRAHPTRAQKETIRKEIERLFNLGKGKFAWTEHGLYESDDLETDGSCRTAQAFLEMPKITYPEDDSRFYKDASKWLDFVQPKTLAPHQRSAQYAGNQLRCQYVGWDGNITPPLTDWTKPLQWDSRDSEQLKMIARWLSAGVETALYQPYELDITTDGFKSGTLPSSGLREPYTLTPPDSLLLFDPPHFGSLDWSLIPTIPVVKEVTIFVPENANAVVRIATTHKAKVKQDYAAEKKEDRRSKQKQARNDFKYHRNRQQLENNPFVPKANIYIRPAQICDIPQITELFNHYVENTIDAIECKPIEEHVMAARFNVAERENKAFLVAILKPPEGAKPPNAQANASRGYRGQRRRQARRHDTVDAITCETVVGFSCLERFSLWESAFHNTSELYLYVHHKYLRMGIGMNLMDRMMPSVDRFRHTHSGTDFIPPDRAAQRSYEMGGLAGIKKLVVSVFYRTGEEDDFRWKKRWLEEKWQFDQASYMHNIAEKFGQPYHMAQFVRETMLQTGGTWSSHWPNHDKAVHNVVAHI